MDVSYRYLLTLWLRLMSDALWSKRAIATFVTSYALAWVIWWRIWGPTTASEQAIENLIPGLTGVLVLVLFIAIMKFGEARTVARIESNESRRINALQDSKSNQILFWLSGRLANSEIGVLRAYLFGSVTHNDYATVDVDVCVLFNQMSDVAYNRKMRQIQPITREFKRTFNNPLHLQKFLAEEEDEFEDFLGKQSNPILIIGLRNEQRPSYNYS